MLLCITQYIESTVKIKFRQIVLPKFQETFVNNYKIHKMNHISRNGNVYLKMCYLKKSNLHHDIKLWSELFIKRK